MQGCILGCGNDFITQQVEGGTSRHNLCLEHLRKTGTSRYQSLTKSKLSSHNSFQKDSQQSLGGRSPDYAEEEILEMAMSILGNTYC